MAAVQTQQLPCPPFLPTASLLCSLLSVPGTPQAHSCLGPLHLLFTFGKEGSMKSISKEYINKGEREQALEVPSPWAMGLSSTLKYFSSGPWPGFQHR